MLSNSTTTVDGLVKYSNEKHRLFMNHNLSSHWEGGDKSLANVTGKNARFMHCTCLDRQTKGDKYHACVCGVGERKRNNIQFFFKRTQERETIPAKSVARGAYHIIRGTNAYPKVGREL